MDLDIFQVSPFIYTPSRQKEFIIIIFLYINYKSVHLVLYNNFKVSTYPPDPSIVSIPVRGTFYGQIKENFQP